MEQEVLNSEMVEYLLGAKTAVGCFRGVIIVCVLRRGVIIERGERGVDVDWKELMRNRHCRLRRANAGN